MRHSPAIPLLICTALGALPSLRVSPHLADWSVLVFVWRCYLWIQIEAWLSNPNELLSEGQWLFWSRHLLLLVCQLFYVTSRTPRVLWLLFIILCCHLVVIRNQTDLSWLATCTHPHRDSGRHSLSVQDIPGIQCSWKTPIRKDFQPSPHPLLPVLRP